MHDVIIVGGGPAGSALGIHLATAGLDALIVDKAGFPRHKVCGELLNARGMKALSGLGCMETVDALGYTRIRGCTVVVDGEVASRGALPKMPGGADYAYAIPRYVLDEIIFRRAQEAGARTLEGCQVTSFESRPDRVVVEAVGPENEPLELEARLIVGADGAQSTVARIAGLEVRDERYTGIAMRSYGEGYPQLETTLFFDRDFFPGLGWAFPSRDGRFNIGVGMMAQTAKRDRVHLRDFFDRISADVVARGRRQGFEPVVHPTQGWALRNYGGARANYFEKGLLIGDAGSFADPLTGEGIPMAMETAELAAETLRAACAAGEYGAEFLSRYENAWRRRYDVDSLLADYILTVSRNPHLVDLMMDTLKVLNRVADRDEPYALTAAGVYTGVLPLRDVFSPQFMFRPLLKGPGFWREVLDLSPDRPVVDFMRQMWNGLDLSLAAMRSMLDDSDRSIEWWLELNRKQMRLFEAFARASGGAATGAAGK